MGLLNPGTGERFVAVDDDEPPSARPQAQLERSAPWVAAADERITTSEPVELDRVAGLLAAALADLGAPGDAEASLRLVDPDEIALLKAEYLDGDGAPTDVLSFPVDGVGPDAELIGDVVLCPSVALEQAPTHAGTFEDELALLVVHSALHLAGWDHADPDERSQMWSAEQDMLERLHRPLTNNPWREP